MITITDIKKSNSIYNIPKYVHCNRGVVFDFRLFQALDNPNYENNKDYRYDFDVFLPKYDMNLQRPYVWEHHQQNEFILSILLEKNIEPMVLVQHNSDHNRTDTINFVIDGKQRLMTVQKFIHNEFPVIINGKECYWKDFDEDAQRFFKSRVNSFTANVYYSYDDAPVTDDMRIILFNYYNFAGTPQTEEHKNKLQSLLEK